MCSIGSLLESMVVSFDPPTTIALACVLGIFALTLLRCAVIYFRVHAGDLLLEATLELKLPAVHQTEFTCRERKRIRVVLHMLNSATACLGGTILLTASDGTNQRTIHEFKEPDALLNRLVTNRRAKHWAKGTGQSNDPVIIDLPEDFTSVGTHLLTLDLQWNFLGTRLEKLIPLMRVTSIELLVRSI